MTIFFLNLRLCFKFFNWHCKIDSGLWLKLLQKLRKRHKWLNFENWNWLSNFAKKSQLLSQRQNWTSLPTSSYILAPTVQQSVSAMHQSQWGPYSSISGHAAHFINGSRIGDSACAMRRGLCAAPLSAGLRQGSVHVRRRLRLWTAPRDDPGRR